MRHNKVMKLKFFVASSKITVKSKTTGLRRKKSVITSCTMTISNIVTGEAMSLRATKSSISLTHNRLQNTSATAVRKLTAEFNRYMTESVRSRYNNKQRLLTVFKILRRLSLGKSFTTINNRFKKEITPIVIDL